MSTSVPGWTGSPGGPTPPTPSQESFRLFQQGEGPPPDLPPYDAETGTYLDGASAVSPQESFRLWQQGEGPPPDLPPYDAETGTYLDPTGSGFSPSVSTPGALYPQGDAESVTFGSPPLTNPLSPEVVSGPGGGGSSAVDYLNQLANQPTPNINIDASFLGDVLQEGYNYTSELRQFSDVAIQDQQAALQDRRDRFWAEAPSRYARAGVIDNLGAGQRQFTNVQDPFVADALLAHGYAQEEIDEIAGATSGYFEDILTRLPVIEQELRGRVGVAFAEIDKQGIMDAMLLEQGQENERQAAALYEGINTFAADVQVAVNQQAEQIEQQNRILNKTMELGLPPPM